MRIAVLGMWHLGTVIAGCLASTGYSVLGFDRDEKTIAALNEVKLPVAEPDLDELIRTGIQRGTLRFSSNAKDISDSDVVWVAYDTPVDEEDTADVDFVLDNVYSLFPYIKCRALVVVSSQMPVGSVKILEDKCRRAIPEGLVTFACLPENLRLGKAISVFTNPDRVVAGIRSEEARALIERLLRPFTSNIVWMGVESAEMTKHGINSFLAASVAFANELAAVCEQYGADAGEVEKGLKSDARIGHGAYLKPGNPFSGGTLARDINYLLKLGQRKRVATHLFAGVLESNNTHKLWSRGKLSEVLGSLSGKRVATLGLTYKPGTNALRRSASIETCKWLSGQGAYVSAFDPAIGALPEELAEFIMLAPSPEKALDGADAVLIGTEWPVFRSISAQEILLRMNTPIVLDPGKFLVSTLKNDRRIRYLSVGTPI